MKNFGVFDVLGPIMVGPSSSHTAGAARLGKIAKTIAGDEIKEVTFLLHGSFGKTYTGHGTDRALVAGILGMKPCDDNLKNSLELARENGIKINFIEHDLGDVHPNTVKFLIKCTNGKECQVVGSSIGGGCIEVSEINENKVQLTGVYPTIITCHNDIPGTVAKVAALLYDDKINIAFMKLVRSQKGKGATMTFEVDSKVSEKVVKEIREIEGIERVIVINPEEDGE